MHQTNSIQDTSNNTDNATLQIHMIPYTNGFETIFFPGHLQITVGLEGTLNDFLPIVKQLQCSVLYVTTEKLVLQSIYSRSVLAPFKYFY